MVSGSVPGRHAPRASTAELTNYSPGSSDFLAQKCTAFGCCSGSRRRFLGSVLNIDDIAIDLFRGATLQFQRGSDLLCYVVDHRHRVPFLGDGHALHTGPGAALDARADVLDLDCGVLDALCQSPHLDGGVQGQKVESIETRIPAVGPRVQVCVAEVAVRFGKAAVR